jgi:hypothetical protein
MLAEFAPVAAAVASDVRATTELSRLLSESDSWIEGAVDLLSTAMVQVCGRMRSMRTYADVCGRVLACADVWYGAGDGRGGEATNN